MRIGAQKSRLGVDAEEASLRGCPAWRAAVQARLHRLAQNLRATAPAWWALLAVSVAVAGCADAAILELRMGFFGNGFNSIALDSWVLIVRFVLAGAIADAFFVLLLWSGLVPLCSQMRVSPAGTFLFVSACTLAAIACMVVVMHRIHSYFGVIVDIYTHGSFAEGRLASLLREYLPEVTSLLLVLTSIAAAAGAALLLARTVVHRFGTAAGELVPPRASLLCAGALLFGVPTLVNLAWSSAFADPVREGLRRKPSAEILARTFEWLTDIDRDGYGLLSRPTDPAPFDAAVFPYAIDRAENGIDENDIAGDHPAGFSLSPPIEASTAPSRGGPHVLLVFLESFRNDVLDAQVAGRDVTPTLDRLARRGGRSSEYYVHSPFTVASRSQLFCGCLVPQKDQETLIDDFRRRGYVTAYFSGQDDTFGGSRDLVGWNRAHRFYDARSDIDRRTSRSLHPSSLQVSAKTVNERVGAFLDRHDFDQPLFLYVNFVDTHYPYHHAEIDDLLRVVPLSRSEISASNRFRVWQTYLNTAANVDRAVGELIRHWSERVGSRSHAIVVTGDHGEALYENGFLGHGQSLGEEQVRVPLIVWDLGGDWPEPGALSDLRGLLLRAVDEAGDERAHRPRFVRDPGRRIVQYTPTLERPALISLRGRNGVTTFRFRDREVTARNAAGEPVVPLRDEFRTLVWSWEELQRRAGAR